MLDDKKLKEIQSRVKNYVSDGIIKTRGNKEFVDFFVNNSRDSLNSANALFDLSTDKDMQEKKAKTSLERAKRFNIEIRKMIETD